ncbi:MAG: glycosyltransferase [Actinomycetota bacterium]|nr:glycosyltransferase [Actinomycetota bacterium]
MQWLVGLLLLGFSFTLWMTIGGIRFAQTYLVPVTPDRQQRHSARKKEGHGSTNGLTSLSPVDVAVLIPAHNEELTIGATLQSAMRLVPVSNIHVIADGCNDDTAAIARLHGANVLTLSPAQGKAAGIEAAVQHFSICRRFAVLLILDADTQLDENYLRRGLALLDDPEMGAVAGYAHTTWRPDQLNISGRFLVAYRTRLYAVMQWIKYGQTWRYTNVTPIVPGFASMYRTRAVSRMELNPPGLVIEDFNMTFELHRKRLGKVAFEPSVFGRTQDPDNLNDYYRQIMRWWLGFWQTLRRHGLWWSWFWAVLCIFLVEVLIASIVLTLAAVAVIVIAAAPISGGLMLEMAWYTTFYDTISPVLTPTNLLLFAFVPDYALTCAVAIWMRRPSLLIYGFGFLFIRVIDSAAALWTLQQSWRKRSTGRWRSPRRRTVSVPRHEDGILEARPGESAVATSLAATVGTTTSMEGRHRRLFFTPQAMPVLRDTLLVSTLLAVATWIVMVAVPVTVALAVGLMALVIGVVWSHLRQVRRAE